MIRYLLPFGFAFFSVFIFVPIIRKIAYNLNFVDIPNSRKVHKEPIPLLGGLAIYIGYILSIWLWSDSNELNLIISITGFMVVGIGLLDDYYKTRKKEFPALPKLIIQIIAALLLFALGIKIEAISSLHSEIINFTPGISLLVSLLWILGLMNMINFLDGLDGLASGISLISATTLFLIAFIKGQESIALLLVILMGVNLGFLKYNFYPAKIFMGDSGSLFLGLILAIISIEGALKSATLLSIMMVVFALGVPFFDTVIVLINRWKNKKPLYIADQTHAHHRLLNRGFNQKQAVTIIYVISIIFSLISIGVLYLLVL